MNLKKLYTKSGEHSSPLSLFRNLITFIHCVIFVLLDYEKVWKNSGFLKSNEGLLCTPDLVCSFIKFICYIFQRESFKYIQLVRIS